MENIIIVAVKGIIVHEKKVLIIKRSKDDDVCGGTWEFVGGKMEFGEELEEALAREVMEEVSLKISVDRLLYTATFKTHVYRQLVILTYLCHSDTRDVTLSFEHSDYLWATKMELEELLEPGIWVDIINNNVLDKIEIE